MDTLLVETQVETKQEAVQRAARDFAEALAASPQYAAFERAAEALEKDARKTRLIWTG